MKIGIRSVTPYQMLRLVDLKNGELCTDNENLDSKQHVLGWFFETENNNDC